MKINRTLNLACLAVGLAFFSAGCSALTQDTGDDSGSAASDETEIEAAVTGAVDSINESISSSSSDSAASFSALVDGTSFVTKSSGANVMRRRIHCEDEDDYSEVFTCDTENNAASRIVTFEDCEISGTYRDIELNGSFTNTITNGGTDFCSEDSEEVDFAKMVMGTESGDAIHEHNTGDDDMVYTFTNIRGHEVTVTETSSHEITYTDATDEDADGSAEIVTATISRTHHIDHVIGNTQAHDIDIFTTETDFVSVDGDTETTIDVTLPVHTLVFDEDGYITTRTIESGNLIVDHNLAQKRVVFGVGDDGLTFDLTTDNCGPESGTMIFTVYDIEDDGTIGASTGSGSVTFANGELDEAELDGDAINVRPRPCH